MSRQKRNRKCCELLQFGHAQIAGNGVPVTSDLGMPELEQFTTFPISFLPGHFFSSPGRSKLRAKGPTTDVSKVRSRKVTRPVDIGAGGSSLISVILPIVVLDNCPTWKLIEPHRNPSRNLADGS